MNQSFISTIIMHQIRLTRHDPFPFLMLMLAPSTLLVFVTPGLKGGAITAVPALASLFGCYGFGIIAFYFYREHGWNTWRRLLVSGAKPWHVFIGIGTVPYLLLCLQKVELGLFGALLLDMPLPHQLGFSVLMILLTSALELSIGLLITVACRTINQANSIASLGGMLLVGIGGGFALSEDLPEPIATVKYVSPAYWIIRAMREVISGSNQAAEIAFTLTVVAGLSVLFFTFVALRFNPSDAKSMG